MQDHLYNFLLHLGDNALVLGHRLSEWCGHGPILEQDMAMTNIALDLVGQSRNIFQLAANIKGDGASEDTLAYTRDAIAYKNVLLVEQKNGDFGKTILRQFLYDAFNYARYQRLLTSNNKDLAAIAEKSIKEITYHLKWSSEWVIRLGDGTTESNRRINEALEDLWPYTGEMFKPADYEIACHEAGIYPDLDGLKSDWDEEVKTIFAEAGLTVPGEAWMHDGGKRGVHSEHLGYLLAEMQFLQRAYPGQEW